jgi:site-specific DNA-methyltransferase (adenine-specific)
MNKEELMYNLYLGDAESQLKNVEDESIDLVVTSPPYDSLRKYNGIGDTWNHDKFCAIASELYRVVKPGGVVVWVVNDKTEKVVKQERLSDKHYILWILVLI